jgi:hypothetical protein
MFQLAVLRKVGKIFALIAAAVTLPLLAYTVKAGTDNGQGNGGQNNGNQNGHNHFPVVPEVNTVWVLVPVAGAVLLLSWRRFSRAKG